MLIIVRDVGLFWGKLGILIGMVRKEMKKFKFTKIGFGEVTTTKSGKKAIILSLDPNAKDAMYREDFEKKVWIFKNEHSTRIPYTVMAPMPNTYSFSEQKQRLSEE